MATLWSELKRRNVIRVAIAYVMGAWLLMQVADVLFDLFALPETILLIIGLLLLAGLPAVVCGAWIFEVTPAGVRRAAAVDPEQSITGETGHRLNLLTFVFAIGLVGFFLIDRFVLDDLPAKGSATEPQSGGQVATGAGTSIAVLPFVDMSADQADAYFSDGISETLRSVLARLPRTRVAASDSSSRFRGQNRNVRQIGQQLGVALVLEGSVQMADDQVRITTRLIETADGLQLWSRAYDRPLADVIVLQAEIAGEVARALEPNLAESAIQLLTAGYTLDFQAYDLYLLGRHHFARRDLENLQKAWWYFDQAIAADPDFALAYVGLADSVLSLQDSPATFGALSYAEVVSRARPAIDKALELEPLLAEAHATLGLLLSQGPESGAGLAHFERAISLQPNYAMAHLWYGLQLLPQLRFADAHRAFGAAARLDPLTPVVLARTSVPLFVTGDRAAAEAVMRDLIRLAPEASFGYAYLAFMKYQWGQLPEALQLAEQATAIQPLGFPASIRGLILLALADMPAAAAWLTGENRALYLAATADWEPLVAFEQRRLETTSLRAETMISLGQAEMQRGNLELALEYFQLPEIGPDEAHAALYDAEGVYFYGSLPALDLANLYRQLGLTENAEAQLARCSDYLLQLTEADADTPPLDYVFAGYLALTGQTDAAFARLERAIDGGWRNAWLLRIDLNLAPLRTDARFSALLERIERQNKSRAGREI